MWPFSNIGCAPDQRQSLECELAFKTTSAALQSLHFDVWPLRYRAWAITDEKNIPFIAPNTLNHNQMSASVVRESILYTKHETAYKIGCFVRYQIGQQEMQRAAKTICWFIYLAIDKLRRWKLERNLRQKEQGEELKHNYPAILILSLK